MDVTLKNLKVPVEAWKLLRLIAATTGEQQRAILARLLTREWERVQAQVIAKESSDV